MVNFSFLQSIKSGFSIVPKYSEQLCPPSHKAAQNLVSKRWIFTPFLDGWPLQKFTCLCSLSNLHVLQTYWNPQAINILFSWKRPMPETQVRHLELSAMTYILQIRTPKICKNCFVNDQFLIIKYNFTQFKLNRICGDLQYTSNQSFVDVAYRGCKVHSKQGSERPSE